MSHAGTSRPAIPPVDLLADVRDQLLRIAAGRVVVGAVPRQREAVLVLIGAAQLPAAEHRVERAVPAAAELLVAAERQAQARADREAVGPIVGRDAILEHAVLRIEVAQLVVQRRARVLHGERVAAAEALFDLERRRVVAIGSRRTPRSPNVPNSGNGRSSCDAGHGGAVDGAARQQARERIGHVRRQQRLDRRVARTRGREVLRSECCWSGARRAG